MTWQEMIDFALAKLWGISASQYPDAEIDLNLAYHYVKRQIVSIREDYFWDIIKVSATVIWQSEYRIPTITTWDEAFRTKVQKIMWVSVKYSDTSDFKKLELRHQYQLWDDLSLYGERQSQTKPFFFIADDSYFIYPAPQNVVSSWIVVYWIKWLIDIDKDTTEAEMFGGKIPTDFHYVVPMYMRYFYYLNRWVDFKNDASFALQNYDKAEKEMLSYLKLRKDWVIPKRQPNG